LVEVSLPIRSDDIQPEDWGADTKIARLSHQYMDGRRFPLSIVSLNAEIYDGLPASNEILDISSLRNMKEDEIIRNVLAKAKPEFRFRKMESSDNQNVDAEFIESGEMLVIKLEIRLRVPVSLGIGNQVNAQIDHLELNWPTIVTQQGLRIIKDVQTSGGVQFFQQDWLYCPDNLSIEMSSLQLSLVSQKKIQSQPFNNYCINLYLLVRASEGLIKQDYLHGHMQIKVKNILFSGRDIVWLESTGKRKTDPSKQTSVKKQSLFNVDFEITLSELFDKRQTMISHQWHFPGVYLNANRLADLQGILKDTGYEVDSPEIGYETENIDAKGAEKENTGKFKLAKVSGRRYHVKPGEKIRKMDVELWAIKTAATETVREHEIASQGVYKSSLPTNDLVIILFGNIDGAAELLSKDAQRIVTKLKKRLKAVADAR
jgi:hypothetical protein